MFRRLIGVAVVVGAGVAGYRLVVEPWRRAWGAPPNERSKPLAGDDVVADGITAETRGITIAAPPEAVWRWLVQMGYGRAGWYSYDQIDMNRPSSTRILEEHQQLGVGEVVPTHPAGGFVVKALEPERHLVLYIDTDIVRQQAQDAADADPTPANVKMAGAFMEGAQPTDFAASWAFVLEDAGDGRTRLIERMRVRFGESDKPWIRFSMPLMGFGVFLMMRKQLLGIRDRAERAPMPEPVAA
jgi:uncharacterized protein YndB with AHSA1/START domain